MGKAQEAISDIGSSLAGFSEPGGSVSESLGWDRARLSALLGWLGFRCGAFLALSKSLPLTGAASIGLGYEQRTGGSSCGLLSWWRSGLGDLATPEGLNEAHLSATLGAWFTQCEG